MKVSILTWPTAAMFWKMSFTDKKGNILYLAVARGMELFVLWFFSLITDTLLTYSRQNSNQCSGHLCVDKQNASHLPRRWWLNMPLRNSKNPVFSKPQWQVWIWIKIRANWNFTKYCSVLHEILAKHLNFG